VVGFQWAFANRDSTPQPGDRQSSCFDDPTSGRQQLVDVLTGSILGSDWHSAVFYRCWNDFSRLLLAGGLEGTTFVRGFAVAAMKT
jgi:hypothetical protein